MTSPTSDLSEKSKRFVRLCKLLIEAQGKTCSTGGQRQADLYGITFVLVDYCTQLVVTDWRPTVKENSSWLGVVWDDRSGGRKIVDLDPYIEILQKELLLESLADV